VGGELLFQSSKMEVSVMPNGYCFIDIESILERINGPQLVGCGGVKEEARLRCLEGGGTALECDEVAQRAWDNCIEMQDALRRIANILRGVAAKQLLADKERTNKMWSIIFNDREKAMVFSKHLAQALKETKINLEDDETFSCLVFVSKKPEYLSAIIPPASQDMDSRSNARLFQIMEPKIMEAVLDIVEKDKVPK
jgi:hypothetical protein